MAQYPENTLAAMRGSADAVDMIETDIRRCGSGELVAFHDETLDRITDLSGPVRDAPYDRLRTARVHDSGEGIPLLEAVFDAVPSSVGLNLELKVDDVAGEVVSMADRHDHEVLVSSFDPTALTKTRAAGCQSVAYLFSEDPVESLSLADELGCTAVHPHYRLCLDTDLVQRAHHRGLDVNTWTVERRSQVTALREADVDGVILDDCDLAEEAS